MATDPTRPPPAPPDTRRAALTVAEVARRYGVTAHTVLAWIRSGDLRAVNVGRRPGARPSWRITPEALAGFESRRAPGPGRPTRGRGRRRQAKDHVEFY